MECIFKWFESNGHAAFMNTILAFIAIIISIVALWKNNRTQKRLQRYDRGKARLKASGIKEIHSTGGASFYISIENMSNFAEARDIKIKLDGILIETHPEVITKETPNPLGHNTSARLLVADKFGDVKVPNIEITWTDNSGESGFYRSSISFL